MAFLTWSSAYEFGIPEIDEQHKHWLELLNKFYDQLQGNNLSDHLLTLLNDAIEYTKYHFEEEEKFMSSMGYPAISEQKMMHAEIGKLIMSYKEKLEKGMPLVSLKVTTEFKNWFNQHILVEDKKYARIYLASHQK